MKRQISIEFADSPNMGELAKAVASMSKEAPDTATIVLSLGDKGSQRDPWTYLRGLTAQWEDER